jgi:outer membrane protein assembly factor BamB
MRRINWIIAAVLVVVLLTLAFTLRWAAHRPRYVPDADLLEELQSAELPEPALPLAEAWPQWRGPNRDGAASFPELRTDWAELTPRHKIPGGDGYSSFALRDGLAWTLLQADDQEALVCLEVATGQEKWRHAYTPEKTFDYGGPRSTPTVDGDDVFSVASDGRVMRAKATTGEVVWEVPLGLSPPRWGFAASPLVVGEKIYAAGVAFDRETGSRLWGLKDAPGYSSPLALSLAGDRQILFFAGSHLVAVAAEDGAERWRFPWPTFSQVNAAMPVVIPARTNTSKYAYIFISSGYGKGTALLKVAPDARGRVRVQPVYETNELCCHFASPVRVGDYLYGLDEERDLTCLNLRTGEVQWRQRGFRKGSLIRLDDKLLLLGETGNLALVQANPEKYQELAKARPFRDRCWAAPAFAAGQLLMRDRKTIQIWDLRR